MTKKFYVGTGIENTWIAQADRPGQRSLDVFEQMQHYDRWREDLELAKELGINAIRYSVPWYRSNPAPGKYDWDWIAEPLEWLVDHGITPVVDLVHYGTPTWMDNAILNNRFPELLADYAHAFAQRFAGLVNHYTPMNEPQGCAPPYWPPYLHGVDGWVTLSRPVAKAIVLTSRALRDACPGCCLISAESDHQLPFEALTAAAGLPDTVTDTTFRWRLFPASLAYGKILPDDPLVQALKRMGYADDDFQWFLEHAEPPDILGYNYYPHNYFDLEIITPIEVRERLFQDLTEVHAEFGLPVYVTETSSGLTDEKKIQWVRALGDLRQKAREQELPLCGINWWPLFETIQWDYRDNGKSVTECIKPGPGGWNNGLYVINKEPAASLERIPTGAVAEFRTLCADVLKDTE